MLRIVRLDDPRSRPARATFVLAVRSEVEAVAEFGGEHSRVVEVEAADGDGVVQQHAVVGDVDGIAGREVPVFAEAVAGGDIEGGVDGQDRGRCRGR